MKGGLGDALLGKRNWSLRSTLLLWLLILLVPLRMVTAYLSYNHTRQTTVAAFDLGIEDTIRGISALVQEKDGKLVLDINREVVKMLETNTLDMIYFQVFDSHKNYLGGNVHFESADIQENSIQFTDAIVNSEPVRLATFRHAIETSQGRDWIQVQVAQTLKGRNHTLYVSLLDLLVDLLVTVMILILAIWGCVYLGLRILGKIGHSLDSRSRNDFSPLPVDLLPNEIRPLIQSFNALLVRLEDDISIQRRFLDNAAHELKTPLAGIRTLSDLMQREKDSEHRDALVRKIGDSVIRTSNLSKKLLSLSHAAVFMSKRDQFSLSDLSVICKEVIIAYQQEAELKQIDLGYIGTADRILVYGDGGALRELFSNLVENALKYTRAGGAVSLELRDGDQPEVRVIDNGPGIPSEEHPRIFERFYRVLGSSEEGSGLGLSIVKEIADAHRAEVHIEPGEGGVGTMFRVRFPSRKAWEASRIL